MKDLFSLAGRTALMGSTQTVDGGAAFVNVGGG
jgi:hypothetical protein